MNIKQIIARRTKSTAFKVWTCIDNRIEIDFRKICTQFQFEVIGTDIYESFKQYCVVYYGEKILFGLRCVQLGKEIARVEDEHHANR